MMLVICIPFFVKCPFRSFLSVFLLSFLSGCLSFSHWFVGSSLHDVECTYCKCFLPSVAYGVHVFSDIPKVCPCESTEVIHSPWHRGLLFFASDVEVGASFCQYSHTRAPLGCWLYKVERGLSKFLAHLFRCWHL